MIYLKFLPIFFFFFSGIILRKAKIFSANDGNAFLRYIFYIALPCLILVSIPSIEFQKEDMALSLAGVLIYVGSGILIFVISWLYNFTDLRKKGSFILAGMILNLTFTLPFIEIVIGKEGIARMAVLDLGNGLMIFTLCYGIACWYGGNASHWSKLLKRFVSAPPVIAIFIALLIKFFHLSIPKNLFELFNISGKTVFPLVMLSLGILFNFHGIHWKHSILLIIIRISGGLLIAFLINYFLQFQGINEKIVLIACCAPAGFNTILFASRENLDEEYASGLVSSSILAGLLYFPLILFYI